MFQKRKKLCSIFIAVIVCIVLTSCASAPSATEEDPSQPSNVPTESPETPVSEEPVDMSAIYSEAMNAEESGNTLRAMQLFMSIYQYQDAWEQYDSLLMNPRIAFGDGYIAFVTDAGDLVTEGQRTSELFDTAGKNNVWSNLKAISAHGLGLIGLKNDGTVVATSGNKDSKWYAGAEVVDDWTEIVKIDCGSYHTLGLQSDGTVVSTRFLADNEYNRGQYNVSSWNNIISIAAGSKHSIGLKSDGTVVACGDNSEGQCDVEKWSDIVQISANGDWSVGLKSDGTVVYTGGGIFTSTEEALRQSELWSNIVSVLIGTPLVGLKADGTVVAAGSNNNGELDVETWEDMRCAVSGGSKTIGVTNDGTIIFIGNDSYKVDSINGYNLFSGEKGAPILPKLTLPADFPADIPLLDMVKIVQVSEQKDAMVVTFETTASFDEAFSYYESWCASRGGYLKTPYEGKLDMLITPVHDISKALTIIVTNGIVDENGNQSDNCAVILMLSGGKTYESVSNLK